MRVSIPIWTTYVNFPQLELEAEDQLCHSLSDQKTSEDCEQVPDQNHSLLCEFDHPLHLWNHLQSAAVPQISKSEEQVSD